jgi:hypothetical protein
MGSASLAARSSAPTLPRYKGAEAASEEGDHPHPDPHYSVDPVGIVLVGW